MAVDQCVIGVKVLTDVKTLAGITTINTGMPSDYPDAQSYARQVDTWSLTDGAFSPGKTNAASISGWAPFEWAIVGNSQTVGGQTVRNSNVNMALCECLYTSTTQIIFYKDDPVHSDPILSPTIGCTGFDSTYNNTMHAETNETLSASTARSRLLFDFTALPGANYLGFSRYDSATSVTVAPVNVGEVCPVYGIPLPNNQELVSYKRQRTAPAAQEVKTLDGVVRRVRTGAPSTSFSATWQWSDNGQTAATLDKILAKAAETIAPLVVYIPAGIYYNGPFLDLVIPTNEPAVTMPAPGVYSLTIEGTCQP